MKQLSFTTIAFVFLLCMSKNVLAQANQTLSNLVSPTAVNANLLPDTKNKWNLGSVTKAWQNLYFTGSVYLGGNKFINNNGSGNTFIGDSVGAANSTGINNTAVGYYALSGNDSGNNNVANGYNALLNNTGGSNNVANGYKALQYNTSGSNNVAEGLYALINNTTGYSNVAVGIRALKSNITGRNLVAIGDSALFNNGNGATQNYHAIYNTAVGSKALYSNTTGSFNTANGYTALYSNTTGDGNTANGEAALHENTTGYWNIANGAAVLYSNTTGYKNTASGYAALSSNTTGNNNTANGYEALFFNTTGNYNIANGDYALYNNATGYSNVAVGASALYFGGRSNLVAVGDSALFNNGNGVSSAGDATANVAVGSKALFRNSIGRANSGFGFQSLYTNSTGIHNTACGYQGMYTATGNGNTSVGYQAGFTVASGGQNTLIGSTADCSVGTLTNATAIGSGATVNASNKVRVGNTTVTSIGGQVSWSVFSDGRYKKNIKEDVKGLSFINSLRPITYTVDINSLDAYYDKGRKHDSAYEKMKAEMQPSADEASKIVYSGFVAQEVEAAAKKLNYDFSGVDKPGTKDGLYGLRYSDFVVPLVKAVQELSATNDDKQQQIDSLKQNNTALISDNKILHQQLNDITAKINQIENAISQCCTSFSSSINSSNNTSSINKNSDQPKLEQNIPNPFDGSCYISYYIPSGVHSAQLRITDVSGHTLKSYSVTTPGYGKQTIYGSELTSGMYQYSLLIDGKLIDTKKMEYIH